MDNNMNIKKIFKIAAIAVCALLVIIVFFNSITVVPSGQTGVEVKIGKVTGTVFGDGFHFKAPFVTSVVKMDNQIQKESADTNAVSKDLQTVSANIAVNYHLSPENSADMYKNVGKGYVDKILLPAVQESTKAVMAGYNAEGLITNRGKVSVEIEELIQNKTQDYGIIIDSLNIVNFDFSAEFNAAIEQKQVAEQNKLKAETEKAQKIIEAEAQAAEQTIAAQAEADAAKLKAEGEAEAIRVKAEAQAEANQKIAKSLTGAVLQDKAIEKWNGEYPSVVAGDQTSMLIDVTGNNAMGTIPNTIETSQGE